MQRQAWRHIETIQFVIIGGRKIVVPGFHDHVASRARTASAASVFDMNAEIHRDIENRFGFSMFVIRKLAVFEFHGLIQIDESNFGHEDYCIVRSSLN